MKKLQANWLTKYETELKMLVDKIATEIWVEFDMLRRELKHIREREDRFQY